MTCFNKTFFIKSWTSSKFDCVYLRHMDMSTYTHILSKSSLGVIWLWPSGSFFSICVGLTHFSPRPHPTVLFLKHMCGGGRGINECLPRGTCWHRLQIWYWSPVFLLFCSLRHMSSIQGSYIYVCIHLYLHTLFYLFFFFAAGQHYGPSSVWLTAGPWCPWCCGQTASASLHAETQVNDSGMQHPEVELFSFPFLSMAHVGRWDGITAQTKDPLGTVGCEAHMGKQAADELLTWASHHCLREEERRRERGADAGVAL